MASIHKRSQWRVVVDKDTANADVFDTLKQAVAAANALVAQGTVLGFVKEPKKGLAIGPETTLVERVPGGSWSVRIRSKSAPELNKSFERKSDAEEWTAQREGEIPLHQTSCRLPCHADHPRRSDPTCKRINIHQSS